MELESIFYGGGYMYIQRHAEELVKQMISMFKVVLVTGPRQVGKTTLLRHILGDNYSYVTLDDINELEVAKSDPRLFFQNNPGKIIIDEVQNAPELFSEIKRLVDGHDECGTIVLTGSQTFSLMNNVSESLAGRIGILELNGLSLREIKADKFASPVIPNEQYLNSKRTKTPVTELWGIIHRGSLPELYRNEKMDWQLYYSSYVKTYIERDVRMIVNVKDLMLFSKFMVALAARTSQLLNYSTISNELGVDIKTIKSWTSVLETSGIIAIVHPFSNNKLTRVVKTPMLYFMDTGLVCYLLKWLTPDTLMNGAMSGAILETFVVSEIIKSFKNQGFLSVPMNFYRDKDMNEIDIIVEDSGVLFPMEIKKSATPKVAMARHLSLLDKAEGYKTGKKIIMCLVEKKIHLDQEIIAYPISEL
jgi:predicted AAA+ superfamily ATPase